MELMRRASEQRKRSAGDKLIVRIWCELWQNNDCNIFEEQSTDGIELKEKVLFPYC
jgi:hypothetical protein